MIGGISETLYQSGYAFPRETSATGDKSFGDLLAANQAQQAESDIVIPDKWITGRGQGWGIDVAVEFLRDKMGIDVSEREPTHKITDEQKEWLASRHDLDNIHNYTINTPEKQNFLADLVYLNVYTPDEARHLTLVSFPAHTGRVCRVDGVDGGGIFSSANASNFAEIIAGTIDAQRSIIEYIQAKYSDPARSEKEDWEFIQKASAFLENKTECYNTLLDLFE